MCRKCAACGEPIAPKKESMFCSSCHLIGSEYLSEEELEMLLEDIRGAIYNDFTSAEIERILDSE